MGESGARRRTAALLRGVVAAAVLAAATVATGTATDAAPGCPPVPVLRDVTVNQGLGTYTPLARGKQAIVRFYFSLPSCHGKNDAVEVQAGELTVSGTPAGTVVLSPMNVPVAPYDQITPYVSAPAADDPADLAFVVPGHVLDGTGTEELAATFSLRVDYGWRETKSGSFTPGTATFSTSPGTSLPIAAAIGAPSNALRVLVVPIGDAAAGYDAHFPPEARTAVQRGMVATNRALPVRDGVADLHDTTGGLRYTILPALLDIGPAGLDLMANGRFCGTGGTTGTWDPLKRALAAQLQTWNTSNPSAQADRVVAVAWSGISDGSASGCVEGIATVGSPEAYARAIPQASGSTAPSTTGAILTHELFHTFGGVPTDRDDGGYHSTSAQADGAAPYRTFNLFTRQVLGTANRSVMRTSSGWNEDSTLFERLDFELARCLLTPGATTCTTPGALGSAAAGPAWVVFGTTDGTAAGTTIVNSYLDADVVRTAPVPGSDFHVEQRAGDGTLLRDTPIPAPQDSPDDDGDHGAATAGSHTIDVAVDAHPDAETFVLLRGTTELYRRSAGSIPSFVTADSPIAITGARDLTGPDADADTQPALSPDGRHVAWVDANGIRVAPVDASTPASDLLAGGREPTWSHEGGHLTYTTANGEVRAVEVRLDGERPTFGASSLVYSASVVGLGSVPASHPTWLAGGQAIVAAIGGDLWRFELPAPFFTPEPVLCSILTINPGCRRIVATSADERHPSLSASGTLAYARGADVWTATATGGSQAPLLTSASEPAWGGASLAFTRDAGAWLLEGGTEFRLTSGGDSWPAPSADASRLAVERTVSGTRDVVLLDLGRGRRTVVASDDQPQDLRLDVLQRCGDLLVPLRLGIEPTETTATTATFTYDPPVGACTGPFVLQVSDGVHRVVTEVPGEPAPDATPTVAIYAPPASILEGQAIPVAGEGKDPEDGELPPSWTLDGPDFAGRDLGTGQQLADVQPPEGGWTPGTYTLTARVVDGAGQVAVATRTLVVVLDADHDGTPATEDVDCGGASRDDDAASADEDFDGDGIPNRSDASPCTSASNAAVDFDPNTLNVNSTGQPVVLYVSTTACDLRRVQASTVRITSIGGYPANLAATAWSVTGATRAAAQFDRQAVNAFLRDPAHPNLVGRYVPVIVEGAAGSCGFRGFDGSAPVTSAG